MIDKSLDGVLVAFIDFDHTAVVHLDHGKWDRWFQHCMCDSASPYLKEDRTAPLPGMKNFLGILRCKGITAFCLTVSDSSIVVIPKEKVLLEYYGDRTFDKVISVSSRETKLTFIKSYCEAFGIRRSNVLVVDDHPETICECQAAGCKVVTPQQICHWFYAGELAVN